ncbi:MAG: ion transporter [Bacteroidetes bacterium]|nr:MAG: ion transporter [Bacteroidota bacterium]
MFDFITEKRFERFERFIHILIFLNLIAFSLESVEEFKAYITYFELFENVSIIIFIIEYFIRILRAYRKGNPWSYVFSLMGIIDLVSIIPAFLSVYSVVDLRFAKILRFFQIFRIFKLYRYSEHLQTIIEVIYRKKDDLIATMLAITLVIIFSASVTFYLEKDVQPDKFSNIFQSVYWAIETLTTTGYGDIYPKTVGGKIVASVLAIIGIGLVAIPAAILSAGFVEIQDEKAKHKGRKKFQSEG